MIGVNEDIANMDAEGIEHHVHPETLKKLEEFVKQYKEKESGKLEYATSSQNVTNYIFYITSQKEKSQN